MDVLYNCSLKSVLSGQLLAWGVSLLCAFFVCDFVLFVNEIVAKIIRCEFLAFVFLTY